MTSPLYDLDSFAFYSDGTQSGSVIIGSVNTGITVGTGGDKGFATTFFLRMLFQEYNNKADNAVGWKLQYNKNGTGWNDVTTTSSNVRISVSLNLTNHGATTQRIGTGTFISSNDYVDNGDGSTGSTTNWAGNNECETLHSIQVIEADVSDGDTITFRALYDFTSPPDTTTNTPTITISKGAAYNLTIDPGVYSYTGTNIATLIGRLIPIAPGVFSQTGTPVALKRGYLLTVTPGSYSYTGTDVTLTHAAAYPYEYDHEEGDLSDWNSSTGSVSATVAAALGNTSYGLEVTVASGDTSTDYVSGPISAPSADKFRWRFYFDPNTFNYTAGEVAQIVHFITDAGGQTNAINVMFRFGEGNYQVAVWARQDTSNYLYSGYVTISDGPHWIEVSAVRESADGNDDGTVDWWIDDTEQTSNNITSIENYNLWGGIKQVDFGLSYRNQSSFYGTLYMDELVINDTGTTIGPTGQAYDITITPGVYTYTGTAVVLKRGLRISIVAGTYTLTGTDVGTKVGRKLAVDPGVYSHTGTDVGLKRGYKLSIEPGVYSQTGTDPALKAGRRMTVVPGVYTHTGTDVTLIYGSQEVIAIDPGVYTLTGTDVTLRVGRRLSIGPGVYTYTGTDVTLIKGGDKTLAVDPGVYSYAGTDVGLRVGRRISVDPGSYAITGEAIGLLKGLLLALDPGSYTYTGLDVGVLRGFHLSADPGAYVVTGTALGLFVGRHMAVDPGSYTYAGTAVLLQYSAIIFVTPAYRRFTVAADDRVFDIAADDRSFGVAAEDRSYEVGGTE